jgi:hypothetical protein
MLLTGEMKTGDSRALSSVLYKTTVRKYGNNAPFPGFFLKKD